MTFRVALTAAVVAGLVATAVQALVAEPAPGPVALGSGLAVAFLGAGSLAVFVASKDPDVAAIKLVLATYVAKTTMLAALAILVPVPDSFDRPAFAAGLVASALAYVTAETITLARKLRRSP